MPSNPFIQIRSAELGVMPNEAQNLVNDGIYGMAFAIYLQTQLAARGYSTPDVVCEDWGWWVTIAGLPFECGLCVYGFQIDDSNDLDLCMTVSPAERRRWSWRRLWFIDTRHDVEQLYTTVRNILRADENVTIVGESAEFPL